MAEIYYRIHRLLYSEIVFTRKDKERKEKTSKERTEAFLQAISNKQV